MFRIFLKSLKTNLKTIKKSKNWGYFPVKIKFKQNELIVRGRNNFV